MAFDAFDPWMNAYRPAGNEIVRFVGDGPPLLARVLAYDRKRDRVLLALSAGQRRWDYPSNIRQHVAGRNVRGRTFQSRAKGTPKTGRPVDPNCAHQVKLRRRAERQAAACDD